MLSVGLDDGVSGMLADGKKKTRGTTRSFWLHRHSQLSDLMMEKLKETGTSSPLLPAMSPTACCEVGQAHVVLQAFV